MKGFFVVLMLCVSFGSGASEAASIPGPSSNYYILDTGEVWDGSEISATRLVIPTRSEPHFFSGITCVPGSVVYKAVMKIKQIGKSIKTSYSLTNMQTGEIVKHWDYDGDKGRRQSLGSFFFSTRTEPEGQIYNPNCGIISTSLAGVLLPY